jgi:hypothetical protein
MNPFYGLFDLLGIPFENKTKFNSVHKINLFLDYLTTWMNFCLETMKSNDYLFLITTKNLFTFVFTHNYCKTINSSKEQKVLDLKETILAIILTSNIQITLYLYYRVILKYDYFVKIEDFEALINTFMYNNSKLEYLKINPSIIDRLLSSRRIEPYRNINRFINTIILFIQPLFLQEQFCQKLADPSYLCNIDFELCRLILEVQNKTKFDENNLFIYIFETIKIALKNTISITESDVIKYLNISKTNSKNY